jgi:large subunit ribosomal protein L18e
MKNKQLTNLVSEMRKLAIEQKVDFWKKIAKELEKPTRMKREVNTRKIAKVVNEGEVAVVPGKVLGSDKVNNEIAAYQASESAKANNKIMTFEELMKKNPKAEKCRIVC